MSSFLSLRRSLRTYPLHSSSSSSSHTPRLSLSSLNHLSSYLFQFSHSHPSKSQNPYYYKYFSTATKEKLFDKILIANRGEIACRIMRTCKKLGIKTVAIYSEADKNAVHVNTADEAICVGPAQSSQSYLSIPNIVAACKATGAQAVHPGYGFLSENKHFQIALKENGIKFIGPETHAITEMGDKISSKKAAKRAGVNAIPGGDQVTTPEEAVKVARQYGYPVMVKASGGGGGKGMRVAYNDKEAMDGFRLSQQEAISSFGNDSMFIEKFIEEPRHIEVQVLGDSKGNAVYLFERECTIQRRNQKVVEEAPSSFLTPEIRAAMGEQAVMMAKAVGYESAGTVEFLVDKHRKFYYLEMNTRLQVEHPVTELITGYDLVELMIRIAAGHPLPFTQKDIKLKGWALEARVYAEDPLKGFLPSIGKLKRYVEPVGEGIRIDTGVREGTEISVHYDPMIAKVLTYGENRPAAFATMRNALDSLVVRGVNHNVNFLRSLLDHPKFIAGNMSTKFIAEEYPEGYKGLILTPSQKEELIASAFIVQSRTLLNQLTISGQLESFDAGKFHQEELTNVVATMGDDKYRVSVQPMELTPNHQTLQVSITPIPKVSSDSSSTPTPTTSVYEVSSSYVAGDFVFQCVVNGVSSTLQVVSVSQGIPSVRIQKSGTSFTISMQSSKEASLQHHMPLLQVIDTSRMVLSPMPGVIFSINVKVGDEVVAGQEVCIVEAMKMQNALLAQMSGKVKAVHVKKGQTVNGDQVLIEFA